MWKAALSVLVLSLPALAITSHDGSTRAKNTTRPPAESTERLALAAAVQKTADSSYRNAFDGAPTAKLEDLKASDWAGKCASSAGVLQGLALHIYGKSEFDDVKNPVLRKRLDLVMFSTGWSKDAKKLADLTNEEIRERREAQRKTIAEHGPLGPRLDAARPIQDRSIALSWDIAAGNWSQRQSYQLRFGEDGEPLFIRIFNSTTNNEGVTTEVSHCILNKR